MYSEFKTIEQFLSLYPLQIERAYFLPDKPLSLPNEMVSALRFSLENQAEIESEAFYEEAFIFPLLHWAWMRHPQLKLWSHRTLDYDGVLCGQPDYLLARKATGTVRGFLNPPLLAVVEAKRQDFEGGWGQCVAEMLACQKLNKKPTITIFGIVSTGLIWEFGKLNQSQFTKHPISYGLAELERLAGNLDYLFSECGKIRE
jgi:hypothetical protein